MNSFLFDLELVYCCPMSMQSFCTDGTMATGGGSQAAIDPLRLLLFQLDKDMGDNEVTAMKELLFQKQIPKKEFEKLNTAPELFRCLEEKGLISSTNLDLLIELMDAIERRPLKQKIHSYLQKVSRQTHRPSTSTDAYQTQTGKEEVQKAVTPVHSTTTNKGFFKSFGDIVAGVSDMAIQAVGAEQLVGERQKTSYYDPTGEQYYNTNWMSRIHGDTSLAAISIPGTHESLSLHDGHAFGYARCQSKSLPSQLDAGIRFIDVGCRFFNGHLTIHHGQVFQKCSLDNVFDDCLEFLDSHPSETVVMGLAEEYTRDEDSKKLRMDDRVKAYIRDTGCRSKFWEKSGIPEMEKARGKIIIIHNYGGASVGISYSSLKIEDKWKVTVGPSLDEKINGVKYHLDEAAANNDNDMYLTYLSGVGVLCPPSKVALEVNKVAYEKIGRRRKRWGIVAMDFPGKGLIENIIASNFG